MVTSIKQSQSPSWHAKGDILCFLHLFKSRGLCHYITSVCKTSAVHKGNDFSNRQLFKVYHKCRKQMHS